MFRKICYEKKTFAAVSTVFSRNSIVSHGCAGCFAAMDIRLIQTFRSDTGAEIDIQRTFDGYYVVNHDTTFRRVAGVNKMPSEMTLEEVKQLRVDGEPVPTLEDMLEASRDKVTLFVELKGETADKQMADDAVRIIKEMGMEDRAVLISLKYDLISYIEEKYPEMDTGYLAFASFGNTASLNCDYIALEEESVNEELTIEIHENGKKLLVWTINETEDLYHFLNCNADGVITDSVAQAQTVLDNLKQRSIAERMYEYVREGYMYN